MRGHQMSTASIQAILAHAPPVPKIVRPCLKDERSLKPETQRKLLLLNIKEN